MPAQITIPDIQGNFFGGRPYNVSFSMNYSSSPSELTINVINEKGNYSEPTLSWVNPTTIKIGDLNFNGYLVESKNNKTVNQKDLELTYVDCSRLLDVHQVGLHRRHGINPRAKFSFDPLIGISSVLMPSQQIPFLAILGEELHPCDTNKDGNINGLDGNVIVDWCDPCPFCPPEKNEERCTAQNDLEIFDVGYTFQELLSYYGITIPNIVNSYPKVYRDYTGSLRNVLQNWCQEFGLTFYWEFGAKTISNGVKLVDRSIPISINYKPNLCDATEIYEGKSIRNTFASSTISYYARNGEIKSYTCEGIDYYSLECLTFRNLINESNYANPDQYIRWKELGVCLSYYSDSLRDCLYWFNYYGINNADAAKKFIITDTNAQTEKNRTLSIFGNMKIKSVIDVADPNFGECERLLGDSISIYKEYQEELKLTDDNPPYYFFIAECDPQLLAQSFDYDNKLANEFLGKFWIKRGNPQTCGNVGASPRYNNISVNTPEGDSAQWYSQTLDSVYLDFTNFGHQDGSMISEFLQKTREEQNTTYEKDVTLSDGVTQKYNPTASFILMEREGKWFPNNNEANKYEDVIKKYKNLCFTRVDVSSDGKPSIIANINPDWAKNPNIFLFVVQCLPNGKNELPITINKNKNPLEPDQLKNIYADGNDYQSCKAYTANGANNPSSRVIGTYGLKDNDTAWVNFDGFEFMTPVGATELLEKASSYPLQSIPTQDDQNKGKYKVMVKQSFEIKVCIPKIQNTLVAWENPNNCASSEVNFSDISDDDIKIFGFQSCVPSTTELQRIHTEKNVATSISNDAVEKLLQFQIVGTPKNSPTVSQGLDSIDIKVANDGVFTTYTLSDKLRLPPSTDIVVQKSIYKRANKYKTLPNQPSKQAPNG